MLNAFSICYLLLTISCYSEGYTLKLIKVTEKSLFCILLHCCLGLLLTRFRTYMGSFRRMESYSC